MSIMKTNLKTKVLAIGAAAVAAVAGSAAIGMAASSDDPTQSGAAQHLAPRATTGVAVPDVLQARITRNASNSHNSPITLSKTVGFRSATGVGVVGTGLAKDGTAYTCIELAEGSGGCAATSQIGQKDPFGGVTKIGDGLNSITVLVPADTTEAHIGSGTTQTPLTVADGVASGTFKSDGNSITKTLSWTNAAGVVTTHDVVAP